MKKIISLICLAALICSVICSCGSESDNFVEIKADNITTIQWASSAGKDLNKEETKKAIADAYNAAKDTAEESLETDENTEVENRFTIVCESKNENPSVFIFTNFGNGDFNVSVQGAASKGEGSVNYKIHSDDLAKAILNNKVNADVNVRFVVAAGEDDGSGNILEEELEIINGNTMVGGTESDLPKAVNAAVQVLMFEENSIEYKLNDEGTRFISVGERSAVSEKDDENSTITNTSWNLYVNGEKIDDADQGTCTVAKGDKIEYRYETEVISEIKN